jgi:flagellar biosynthesis/type III secretory pathway chaperone
MTTAAGQLAGLEKLMTEEINQYHALIQEIKEEAKYLRENDLASLMKSVNRMEKQREMLLKINERIREELKKVKETTPLPWSAAIFQRVQKHEKEIMSLKERARQLNLQNKSFLQATLGYWKEILGMLASSGKVETYAGAGAKNHPSNPCFLNRQV